MRRPELLAPAGNMEKLHIAVHYGADAVYLGGMAFGTAGMVFTGLVPSIDMFNLPIFLFITPMFLFGGTFFPRIWSARWALRASTRW